MKYLILIFSLLFFGSDGVCEGEAANAGISGFIEYHNAQQKIDFLKRNAADWPSQKTEVTVINKNANDPSSSYVTTQSVGSGAPTLEQLNEVFKSVEVKDKPRDGMTGFIEYHNAQQKIDFLKRNAADWPSQKKEITVIHENGDNLSADNVGINTGGEGSSNLGILLQAFESEKITNKPRDGMTGFIEYHNAQQKIDFLKKNAADWPAEKSQITIDHKTNETSAFAPIFGESSGPSDK